MSFIIWQTWGDIFNCYIFYHMESWQRERNIYFNNLLELILSNNKMVNVSHHGHYKRCKASFRNEFSD